MTTNSTEEKAKLPPELTPEERAFYKTLAEEMIKSSISRIESNASTTLTIVTVLATLYAAIVGFWVTSQNVLTLIGSILLAIPEILLIMSVMFIARVIVPMELTNVSILSPGKTYEAYTSIVKSKASRMKWCFIFLILALVFILIAVLALSMYRDILLHKASST
jgi:hypothetical protein